MQLATVDRYLLEYYINTSLEQYTKYSRSHGRFGKYFSKFFLVQNSLSFEGLKNENVFLNSKKVLTWCKCVHFACENTLK